MSACEFSDRLDAYHDGRLEPNERATIASHLANCADCLRELHQLEAMSRKLSAAKRATISSDALSRIHSAIQEAFDVVIFRFISRLTAVAAAVLLAGGLWLITTQDTAAHAAAPAAWERVAIAPTSAADSSNNSNDTQLAEWIVTDLSAREERQ